jgi:hypothetical protein
VGYVPFFLPSGGVGVVHSLNELTAHMVDVTSTLTGQIKLTPD